LRRNNRYCITGGIGSGKSYVCNLFRERGIEVFDCDASAKQEVYPVRQDEYNRIRKNPFRGANKRRALRLDLSDNVIEIISKVEVTSYYIRYVRKPQPIVLEDMPNGLSVEGESHETECELHESLHQRILELAVRMALQSKGVGLSAPSKDER
jgi:hypothetical protein